MDSNIDKVELDQASKKALVSWAFYDFANSSFAALIETFVFASYFTSSVAASEVEGGYLWGLALGLTGVIIAIIGPILGAIADHKGSRKSWLFIFFALCLISTALLYFVKPSPAYIFMGLVLVILGSIGSECSFIFYNAMLPSLVPKNKIGKWSGIGWAMGYIGGMLALSVAMFALINGSDSWIVLDNTDKEHVRAVFVLTAFWYALFALPLFLFTPDIEPKKETLTKAVKIGLKQLRDSLKEISKYSHLVKFLVARMIYTDGLTTLFLFGGVYAAAAFKMESREVLSFGITLNVAAGMGSFIFAWLDDRIGSRQVIIISLVGLILTSLSLLTVTSIYWFWTIGMILGLFVGPLQASSRAFMAKITPPDKINQMFGLFAFSGKATGFMGPWFVSLMIYLTGSQRFGIAVLIPFFVVGLALIKSVPKEE